MILIIYLSGVFFAYAYLRSWQKEEYGIESSDWFDVIGAATSALGSWVSFVLMLYLRMNEDDLTGKPPKWL